MKFHFEFDIKKLQQSIYHQHNLFLIGSCFTENIGEKLRKYKFKTIENPNGILFNPISVVEAIDDYINNKKITEQDLFNYSEGWHSWKHHSRYSDVTAADAVEKINTSTSAAHHFLKEADYAFITLGSAWLYTFTSKALNAKEDDVAANNHKAPADWFQKRLMTSDEVAAVLEQSIQNLKQFNPKLQIIFTISPVRHLREGVVENNRSKAALITAVHQLVEQHEHLYYFPAYELVIDDLRDHRFYAEDLVHPNYFATQYVWEKLIAACMSEKTKSLMEEIHTINLASNHKPFNPTSEQHNKFLNNFYEKTKALLEQHPYLDLEQELNYFKS